MSSETDPSEPSLQRATADFPQEVGAGLARFVADARAAADDALVSVILYGGLVRGEYDPPSSDVNVLVVLRRADVRVLDALLPPVQQGRAEFGLAPLVLTIDDLTGAADVFPSKFLDLQRCHRLLWGDDALAPLQISREHLRLRCEQELRNLQLRLRTAYLQRALYPEQLAGVLSHAVSTLLNTLSAALTLDGGAAPPTRHEALDAAEARFGLRLGPAKEALAVKSGELTPGEEALKQLYGEFMEAVRQAAEAVDRL
jgi:hypothetical protein